MNEILNKVLITGNLGYIGSAVVRSLREAYPQATLVGADTGYFAHQTTVDPSIRADPTGRPDEQLLVDMRDLPSELLQGVDAIVHLAAVSNDPMGKAFEKVTRDVNYGATLDLARRAAESGVASFVFASSCSMYGTADDRPRTEDSELKPITAYARSKVQAERDLRELAGDGMRVTSLRFATACGMSDRLRLDLVLNDFVASALVTGTIVVLSDGKPWRPLIHVEDMARAIQWAVAREGDEFVAVNTGSDHWNYQIRDLAHAVSEVLPETEVSINTNAEPDKRSYAVDFGLFRQLAPDHQPRVDLETAVRDLADGLRTMGFDDPDFRQSDLMRLRALTGLRESGRLDADLRWVGGGPAPA